MNATELRIGNLVKFGVHIVPIKSIHTESFLKNRIDVYIELNEKMPNNCVGIEDVQPIELTPEILEKMFIGRLINIATDEYRVGKFTFQFARYNNYNSANVFIGGELLGHYEHVHSLQNLIHALTGEELQIEL